MQKKYDIVAVGNALVDVIAEVPDTLLSQLSLTKGSMALCSAEESHAIYSALPPTQQQSGGSAANTLSGLAALSNLQEKGGSYAFMGKIGKDEFGEAFAHDLQSLGIDFTPAYSSAPSGRCLVLVSPDAERTMATYLGASADFSAKDIDAEAIGDCHILYLEGYLFDSADNKQAFYRAAEIAQKHNIQVALTLSDSFCVERHPDDFKKFITSSVDILFANEQEMESLGESNLSPLVFMTRGDKGAIIMQNGVSIETPAVPCDNLTDTTGAGDQFAAGVLYGLRQGRTLSDCANLGAQMATQVISIYGGRLPHTLSFPDGWVKG